MPPYATPDSPKSSYEKDDMEALSILSKGISVGESSPMMMLSSSKKRKLRLWLIIAGLVVFGAGYGVGLGNLHPAAPFESPDTALLFKLQENTAQTQQIEALIHNNTQLMQEIEDVQRSLRAEKAAGRNKTIQLTAQSKALQEAQELPPQELPPLEKQRMPKSHPEWCPNAKCYNTALCKPCQRRFLIVITSPRSASTTLTWMLDSLPGVVMSGENNDALGKIKTMQDGIIGFNQMRWMNKPENQNRKGAWSHRPFVEQSFSCVSQDMIRFINPPKMNKKDPETFDRPRQEAKEIAGFKTVRFFETIESREQEEEMAAWLKDHFPCAKVIVNVNSDVEREAASLKNHFDDFNGMNMKKVSKRKLISYAEKRLNQAKRFAELLGSDTAYLLDKKEWTSGDMSYINNAVRWLGFHESCQFKELLEFNTEGGYGDTKIDLSHPWPETCKPL